MLAELSSGVPETGAGSENKVGDSGVVSSYERVPRPPYRDNHARTTARTLQIADGEAVHGVHGALRQRQGVGQEEPPANQHKLDHN